MVCPFPQKLLISLWSGPMYPPRENRDPQPPKKKTTKRKDPPRPPPPQKKKKKKRKKEKRKKDQREKRKKEKKEGTIFANPPSEDSLVDEPSYGKGS